MCTVGKSVHRDRLRGRKLSSNVTCVTRTTPLCDRRLSSSSFAAGCCADADRGFVALLNSHYEPKGMVFFNTGVGGYTQKNQIGVLRKHFDRINPNCSTMSTMLMTRACPQTFMLYPACG